MAGIEFKVSASDEDDLVAALRVIGQNPRIYVQKGARSVVVDGDRVTIEKEAGR